MRFQLPLIPTTSSLLPLRTPSIAHQIRLRVRRNILAHLRIQRFHTDRAIGLQEYLRVRIARRRAQADDDFAVRLHDVQHFARRLGRAVGEQRDEQRDVVDVLQMRLNVLDAARQFGSVRHVKVDGRTLLGAVRQAAERSTVFILHGRVLGGASLHFEAETVVGRVVGGLIRWASGGVWKEATVWRGNGTGSGGAEVAAGLETAGRKKAIEFAGV